jgi:hypothetical protein
MVVDGNEPATPSDPFPFARAAEDSYCRPAGNCESDVIVGVFHAAREFGILGLVEGRVTAPDLACGRVFPEERGVVFRRDS